MMSAALITLSLLGAAVYDETFVKANEAYAAARYEEAVREYERLVESGVEDADIFCNLGSAYFRLDNLGAAIANFERALRLAPGMETAAHNLGLALKRTERQLEKPLPSTWEQALLFWHYRLPYGTSRALALLTWLLFWGAVALRVWRPWPYLRAASVLLLLASLAFGTSAWYKSRPSTLVVARTISVPVHYGQSAEDTVHYELHEGDRVQFDRRENGWARVTAIDGRRGWAREEQLIFVGPPYEPAVNAAPDAGAGSAAP
jgi:tetratricopeptide (TPR) repeat protein